LGLAVVKKIVEEHKGTVDVSSEIGKGTIFRIRIPSKQHSGRREEPCRPG